MLLTSNPLILLHLTPTLDNRTQISHRQLPKELQVQRSKHNNRQQIPPTHGSPKESTTRPLQKRCSNRHSFRRCPERTSSQAETKRCADEDQDEDDAGAERADQEDEAEHAHEERVEGEGGGESRGLLLGAVGGVG